MITKLFTILSDTFWVESSIQDKKKLWHLLMVWVAFEVFALLFLFYNLIFGDDNTCLLCNILFIAIATLPIICAVNGRINCSVNSVFLLPFILYAYYFSDFNQNSPTFETIYLTVFWLHLGMIFLLYFSDTNIKIRTYFFIGLITVVFQMLKLNLLINSYSLFNPFVTNPIFVFIAVFLFGYAMHVYYKSIIKKNQNQIDL
ncbi:MAG TPA: hypothetical protein P5210_13085, partial [Draconibacterium sp.]|nr:hypothetical protein [Draconibacterium sp.]